MALYPVGAADDKDCVIQDAENPLHLARKINMPRCVQQGDPPFPHRQLRLLGKDRDSPVTLLHVGIQKGISVIHTSQLPDLSACI